MKTSQEEYIEWLERAFLDHTCIPGVFVLTTKQEFVEEVNRRLRGSESDDANCGVHTSTRNANTI